MKFFPACLAALVTFVGACTPITNVRHKQVEDESDAEKIYGLTRPVLNGLTLELSQSSLTLVARKQGKIWHWSMDLRADEMQDTKKLLSYWDLSEFKIATISENQISLSARPASSPANDRGPQTTQLIAAEGKPGVWSGPSPIGGNVTVTCLPVDSQPCDPARASVIEIKSPHPLSNHHPRIIGLVYGQTPLNASVQGTLSERIGTSIKGNLRTVALLNKEADAFTSLVTELETDVDQSTNPRSLSKVMRIAPPTNSKASPLVLKAESERSSSKLEWQASRSDNRWHQFYILNSEVSRGSAIELSAFWGDDAYGKIKLQLERQLSAPQP